MMPCYSKLLQQMALLIAFNLCSLVSHAAINPGTIQGAGGTWPYYCPNSYVQIYNTQLPSGGSGRYIYKWQTRLDTWNPWVPFNSSIFDSSSLNVTKPKTNYWDRVYIRRIAFDYYNLNDSAISNIVEIASFQAFAGKLVFWYGPQNYQEYQLNMPVGTTPPIITSPPGYLPRIDYNDGSLYTDWFFRYDNNPNWQQLNMPSVSSSSYQPPTSNIPVKIWYKREIYDNCNTTYPDGMTDSIYLNFFVPIVFDPGTISSDTNKVCSGSTVHLTSTPSTAPLPFTSWWQYSVDSVNWYYAGFTDTLTVSDIQYDVFYRRRVTSNLTTIYSNVIKINVVTPPGNPSVFGSNQWNVYAYNGKNLTISNAVYRGYYQQNNTNINTINDWADTLSPSVAVGYVGCPVNKDSFTIAARRQGFDTGSYQLRIPKNNDLVVVKINGFSVSTLSCCNVNPPNINLGKMGPTTRVEVIQATGTNGAALKVDFIKIDTANTSSYTDSVCRTVNVRIPAAANQFLQLLDSTGKPVAAVNPNGVALGILSVSTKQSAPGSGNMPIGNFGVLYMPRYFNFTASNYINTPFPGPVTVRLYYLNTEFDDYKVATNQPLLTINDLKVMHYDGFNQDCNVNNNASSGDTLMPVGVGPFGPNAFYIDVPATRFSEFGATGYLSPLPLQWISANASVRKNEILLQWKVANEINNAGFYVLRSADGISYKNVGYVSAKTTGETTQAYTFIDKPQTTAGNLFYQIKQVDKDNRYSLSKVMKVSLDNRGYLVLLPNPVNDVAILKSGAIIKMVCLTDVSGRLLYCNHPLANQATIDVSRLSKGIYLFKALLTTGEEQVIKLVKQ